MTRLHGVGAIIFQHLAHGCEHICTCKIFRAAYLVAADKRKALKHIGLVNVPYLRKDIIIRLAADAFKLGLYKRHIAVHRLFQLACAFSVILVHIGSFRCCQWHSNQLLPISTSAVRGISSFTAFRISSPSTCAARAESFSEASMISSSCICKIR